MSIWRKWKNRDKKKFENLTAKIQKLQNKSNNEPPQLNDPTQELSPEQWAAIKFNDNILDVRLILHKVKEDWYDIGCVLGVHLQFLEAIKKENSGNSKQCLFLMLKEWLAKLVTEGNNDCKYYQLMEALRLPVLGHADLADTLDDWHDDCLWKPYRPERFHPFS